MKAILMPAMSNIVRRLVIECAADGIDAATQAQRMTLEGIGAQLRDEGVWHNGFDWLQRRANRAKLALMEVDRDKLDDERSSSSSNATSPVLSTTTLQTTPSPEPSKDGSSPIQAPAIMPPIPVSPVLEAPTQLVTIPWVPTTFAHLPQYSTNVLKQVRSREQTPSLIPNCRNQVWRDACAPLYHCRCSICDRGRAQKEGGTVSPSVAPALPPRAAAPPPTVEIQPVESAKAQPPIVRSDDLIPSDAESDAYDVYDAASEDPMDDTEPPETPPQLKRMRETDDDSSSPDADPHKRPDTPPKRARIEPQPPVHLASRKRGSPTHSEEGGKRARLSNKGSA
jgi:hypothetical protein